MKKTIHKVLEQNKLLEFGIRRGTIQKYIPNQYLYKKKKGLDDETKILLRKNSEEINKLFKEIDLELRSLRWQDITLYVEGGFFYIVLPESIKNKMELLSDHYGELLYYKYLNFVQPKSEIEQLYKDYEKFIKDDWIYAYVDEPRNRTHFPKGLPKALLGYGIGKKIYKKILDKLKFIQSDKIATDEVQSIYKSLLSLKNINVVVYGKSVLIMDSNLPLDKKIEILSEVIYEKYTMTNWHRRLIYRVPNRSDIVIDANLEKQIGVSKISRMINDIFYESRNYTHEPFTTINI